MTDFNMMDFVPSIVTIILVVGVIMTSNIFLVRHYQAEPKFRYRLQLIKFAIAFVGVLLVIVVLPFSDSTRGQLLSLIGIVLSATIALSSTTFVGNAMAGIMLRSLSSFRIGDFIRVGENFGRVSEMGLLHVEIQTTDRDLMTLPNLYVVTQPTKVIHATGTIISAEVTLGYDVSRRDAESALLEAAQETGLADPFVLLTNLGDYSVTYQVNGLLSEVKQLLSFRSTLNKRMLDHLHQRGIEIVSPSFMNTRAYPAEKQFIPEHSLDVHVETEAGKAEEVVFDIAEDAASLEQVREEYKNLLVLIDEKEKNLEKSTEDQQRKELVKELETLKRRSERMQVAIEQREQTGRSVTRNS